ncbi:MAG: ATP-binding cassette domain-containing protein [Anaerolineales bacterium]|uniref:ABC transporter ATP-binding protein n=1 Tax=Candidatus Villigracilis proximus TaxID=3140683 RepID=UPI003136828A|nr:ATP-binding cassette domain-containing protein [Anaerolineales bacterium]
MNKAPLRTKPKTGPAQVADFAPESMIELRGVIKRFSNAAGEFTVLKGVDLTINRGEFVSIVGKSGSGKSTLLNMITGIDHPTEGLVVVNATDIYTGVTESQRSKWRGKNLGIVFQFFQLLPMLTLLENVMLPMDYVDLYDFDERPARAMELLTLVGLEQFANKLPVLVSTGQQQLAAIARAMACDPPLLVADEPTGNLDTRSADKIIQLFEGFVAQGKTIVMVTHDPSLTSRTNRNIIISDGELINETVSRALPKLRHRHMLEFTRIVEGHVYQPNETILSRDQHVDHFFMIRKGEVEVVLQDEKNQETVISRLKPGEFFGEIELLRGGKSIANVRAASNNPVEVLTLPREDFLRVIHESPITAEALGEIVQKRLDEQRVADRRSVSR